MMAAAESVWATWAAAALMASGAVASGSGCWAPIKRRYRGSRSVRAMMRFIIDTDSRGYSPLADSAESIMASAPS